MILRFKKKKNLLMKSVFFTALKIPEKLTFFHWELEMTDTSLLSGEYSDLLSAFMQAAEDFPPLLSFSDTYYSYVPKPPVKLGPRPCSPPYHLQI